TVVEHPEAGRRWTVSTSTVPEPVPSTTLVPITDNVGGPALSTTVPVPEIVVAPDEKTAFWGLESSTVNVSVCSAVVSPTTLTVIVADLTPGAIDSVPVFWA